MNILLDTHALIWFLEGDDKLSDVAIKHIENPINQKYISIVSYWEMAIKISLNKLELSSTLPETIKTIEKLPIELLTIKPEHTLQLSSLPFHHKDPFDRMLIAQAWVEEMPILSKDEHFSSYPMITIW